MSLGYTTLLRNSRLSEVAALVDAAVGAGKLRIYNGERPATGVAVTTLLAEVTFSTTAFGAPAGGVITAAAIFEDSSADSDGIATWFRVVDGDNLFVYDGDVGTSGSDLNLTTTSITAGIPVSIDSLTITEGNP